MVVADGARSWHTISQYLANTKVGAITIDTVLFDRRHPRELERPLHTHGDYLLRLRGGREIAVLLGPIFIHIFHSS